MAVRQRHSLLWGLLLWSLTLHGQEDDRRRKQEEAAREGDQKTKQLLQPQKMMHDMQKMEHMRRAEEARNRQDFGTAQKEEQMAMMEQTKSDQLQQQMDANQKSADQNREAARKLSQNDDTSQGEQKKGSGYDPNVISLRDGGSSSGRNAPGTEPAPQASEAPPIPAPQLADITQMDRSFLPQPPSAPEAPTAPTSASVAAAEQTARVPNQAERLLGDLERLETRSPASTSAGPGASSGASAQHRLLSAASVGPTPASDDEPAEMDVWGPPAPTSSRPRAAARDKSAETDGAGEEKKSTALGALDGDFFEPCPGPKEARRMKKKGEKLSERCEAVVKRCEKEHQAAKKLTKRGAKPTYTDACKAWDPKQKDKSKTATAPKGKATASAKPKQ